MSLKIQIITFIFCALYGIFFGVLYNICYNFLYKTLLRYKVLINFLFVTNMALIYFAFLLRINEGIIHITFLLITLIFSLISIQKTIKLRKLFTVKIVKKDKIIESEKED